MHANALISLHFIGSFRVAKVGVEGSIPFARSKFFKGLAAVNNDANLFVSVIVSVKTMP
jgi:hypothetical protein